MFLFLFKWLYLYEKVKVQTPCEVKEHRLHKQWTKKQVKEIKEELHIKREVVYTYFLSLFY